MHLKEEIDKEICYNTKINKLRPTLLRFCNSRIYSSVDAEDVTQNTVLILIQKQKEYDSNKSFFSWAMNICRFQIMAYLKKVKRNKEYTEHEEGAFSPDSLGRFFEKMPFQDLIQDEKQKIFDQIKRFLNNREKSIFELSLKGWGSKDIMYSLKISRNSYSASKSRALKKAKDFFQNKNIQDYKV
jgi:RNA polymerase sigma factor (sigma-70 family)